MKKRPLILLSFFLMLYIVPLILAPSYMSPAIPEGLKRPLVSQDTDTFTIRGPDFDAEFIPSNDSAFDMMVDAQSYLAYFLNVSDWGPQLKFQDTEYPDMWYTEDFLELEWADSELITDYINNNQGVTGYIDGDSFVYPSIIPNIDMRLNVTGDRINSDYVLSDMLQQPSEVLGLDIQLSFGYQFRFYSGAIIMFDDGSVWDKDTSRIVNQTIWFLDPSQDPNDVDFRLRSSFSLQAPYAIDAEGDRVQGSFNLRQQGGSFYVRKMIPYDWLNNATYPVVIDPTVVDTTTNSNPFLQHRAGFTGENNHTISFQTGSGLFVSTWHIGFSSMHEEYQVSSDTTITQHTITGYPNNDTIYCFYQRDGADDIYFKKSSDAGASWGSEITVEIGGATALHYPCSGIALSGDHAGRLMVAYRDNSYDTVIRYSDNEGSSWTEVTVCDDATYGDNQPGDIMWLYNQTWVIGIREWEGNNRILIFRTVDGGDTWTYEYSSAEAPGWVEPWIMSPYHTDTNFTGNVTVFTAQNVADTDDLVLWESTDSGDSFTQIARFDDGISDMNVASYSCIADGEGEYWLLGTKDDGAGSVDDVASTYRDGPTWADPLQWTDEAGGRDIHPSSRVVAPQVTNLDGRALVGWVEEQGSPYSITIIELVLGAFDYSAGRDWQFVEDAEFIFPIGWSEEFQFGYDAFFIFLGLIMIPASTMYLARGGRQEMNRTKLFNGLILLAVGIGLVIGGVMP